MSTGVLLFLVGALWLVVMVMAVMMWVMLRQIGILYERIAPVGALMDGGGPAIGEASAIFRLQSLTGGQAEIGTPGNTASLVFFLSPTCPVCKQLLPAIADIQTAERRWLQVILASDGPDGAHRDFVTRESLAGFPYVLSADLGQTYRVQKLPYAVLIDAAGIVRAKGLVNNREQLESLFSALERGVPSVQALSAVRAQTRQPGSAA